MGWLNTALERTGRADSKSVRSLAISFTEEFLQPQGSSLQLVLGVGVVGVSKNGGNGFLAALTAAYYKNEITENYYGALVDPTAAIWNSDHILFPELAAPSIASGETVCSTLLKM